MEISDEFARWWNNRPLEVRYCEELLLKVIKGRSRIVTFDRRKGLPLVTALESEKPLIDLLFDQVVRRLRDMAGIGPDDAPPVAGIIHGQANHKFYDIEIRLTPAGRIMLKSRGRV